MTDAKKKPAKKAKAVEGAEAKAQELNPGTVVLFSLAHGEVREATIKEVNGDGTLNLELAVQEADLPYLIDTERGQAKVERLNVALGDTSKESGVWELKA